MKVFNIGLPKKIVIFYTLIHNFRFLYIWWILHWVFILHVLGILCLYSHGCLQPSDVPDYHTENSRLSKHFEMQWFLQYRINMRFICSTFSFVIETGSDGSILLLVYMPCFSFCVYAQCSFPLSQLCLRYSCS